MVGTGGRTDALGKGHVGQARRPGDGQIGQVGQVMQHGAGPAVWGCLLGKATHPPCSPAAFGSTVLQRPPRRWAAPAALPASAPPAGSGSRRAPSCWCWRRRWTWSLLLDPLQRHSPGFTTAHSARCHRAAPGLEPAHQRLRGARAAARGRHAPCPRARAPPPLSARARPRPGRAERARRGRGSRPPVRPGSSPPVCPGSPRNPRPRAPGLSSRPLPSEPDGAAPAPQAVARTPSLGNRPPAMGGACPGPAPARRARLRGGASRGYRGAPEGTGRYRPVPGSTGGYRGPPRPRSPLCPQDGGVGAAGAAGSGSGGRR